MHGLPVDCGIYSTHHYLNVLLFTGSVTLCAVPWNDPHDPPKLKNIPGSLSEENVGLQAGAQDKTVHATLEGMIQCRNT